MVSNLRQVDGFLWVLWFPPPMKLTAIDISELLLKVALHTIKPNQIKSITTGLNGANDHSVWREFRNVKLEDISTAHNGMQSFLQDKDLGDKAVKIIDFVLQA